MGHLERMVERYPDLLASAQAVSQAYHALETCYTGGGKLLVCGNGGSAADAEHIVGELLKGFFLKRPVSDDFRKKLAESISGDAEFLAERLQGALPAISLVSQVSFITAFSNDVSPEMIFAQQVFAYGRAGDVLLALSTSGNAPNIVHAVRVAGALGMVSIGMTGASGGLLAQISDIIIKVGLECTPDIQERHQAIYHTLCAMLEERFFS